MVIGQTLASTRVQVICTDHVRIGQCQGICTDSAVKKTHNLREANNVTKLKLTTGVISVGQSGAMPPQEGRCPPHEGRYPI